jgi:hypothetical protein
MAGRLANTAELSSEVQVSALFGRSDVLFAEPAWFLARRDDEVVAQLLRGGATQPGAAMAREECTEISQAGH